MCATRSAYVSTCPYNIVQFVWMPNRGPYDARRYSRPHQALSAICSRTANECFGAAARHGIEPCLLSAISTSRHDALYARQVRDLRPQRFDMHMREFALSARNIVV